MLSRPSSSCSTSLWPFSHSRTCPCAELAVSPRIFPSTLPNRLTSPCGLGASAHLWSASHCCAAEARPPPFFGVTCCHLPSVPTASLFLHLPRSIWPTHFLIVNGSPHSSQDLLTPKAAHDKTSAQPAPSTFEAATSASLLFSDLYFRLPSLPGFFPCLLLYLPHHPATNC